MTEPSDKPDRDEIEKLAEELRRIRNDVLVPPAIEALPATILIDKIAEAQAKWLIANFVPRFVYDQLKVEYGKLKVSAAQETDNVLLNFVRRSEHERIVGELKKEHRKECLSLMNPVGRFR